MKYKRAFSSKKRKPTTVLNNNSLPIPKSEIAPEPPYMAPSHLSRSTWENPQKMGDPLFEFFEMSLKCWAVWTENIL